MAARQAWVTMGWGQCRFKPQYFCEPTADIDTRQYLINKRTLRLDRLIASSSPLEKSLLFSSQLWSINPM